MPCAGEEDIVTRTLKHVISSAARSGGIGLRWSSGHDYYRARNWTFDENHFGLFLKFLLERIFWRKPCKKSQWRIWYKMPSKLLGCFGYIKLYIKLAVSLGSFSQFFFPFNF